MKKFLVIVLLIISNYVMGQQDSLQVTEKMIVPFSRYYDSGVLQQSGFVAVLNVYNSNTCESQLVSVCDSVWCLYDSQGKILQLARYRNGLKSDVWEYYFDTYIGQAIYVEGEKVRYLEVDYNGKLLYLKDF